MTVAERPRTPVEVEDAAAPAVPQLDPDPQRTSPWPGRPKWSGDIKSLLDSQRAFSVALRGYNQLEVDNYVAWAETELAAARRLTTELVERLAADETELRNARELLARSEQGRDLARVSDRVAEILRLAAEEADAARRAGIADAEAIVTDARVDADLVMRRAQKLEAQAAARLQDAERRQAEAAVAAERARQEAAKLLKEAAAEQRRLEKRAAAERARLDRQATHARALADAAAAQQRAEQEQESRLACQAAEAAAVTRVTEAERELEVLVDRCEAAREYLRDLTRQVDASLRALTDEPAAAFTFIANQAATPASPAVVPEPSTEVSPAVQGNLARFGAR